MLVPNEERRIDTGEDSLRRRFLVAGRAIDLPRKEQARDRLRFQRRFQVARVVVVVLDGVTRAQDMRLLQPPYAAHELDLHIQGQARRDSVRIKLVGGQPLGLEKNLVALFGGKPMDLVLDRRAIAGSDPLNHAGVHRRAVQAAADDFVRKRVGVGDPTRQLARVHRRRSDK